MLATSVAPSGTVEPLGVEVEPGTSRHEVGVGCPRLEPADGDGVCGHNLASEHGRQRLPAEADPEHGDALADGVAQEGDLVLDPAWLGVVDGIARAHRRDPAEPPRVGRDAVLPDPHHLEGDISLVQPVSEQRRRVERVVLEDEAARHGLRAQRIPTSSPSRRQGPHGPARAPARTPCAPKRRTRPTRTPRVHVGRAYRGARQGGVPARRHASRSQPLARSRCRSRAPPHPLSDS